MQWINFWFSRHMDVRIKFKQCNKATDSNNEVTTT